jgi:hypothetical protein
LIIKKKINIIPQNGLSRQYSGYDLKIEEKVDLDEKSVIKKVERAPLFNFGNNLLFIEKENYYRMNGKFGTICKVRAFDFSN